MNTRQNAPTIKVKDTFTLDLPSTIKLDELRADHPDIKLGFIHNELNKAIFEALCRIEREYNGDV